MIIDTHAHILPGMDDGAGNIKDSLGMARKAIDIGVEVIVATPHVIKGTYDNSWREIKKKVVELNTALKRERLSLKILPGAENYIDTGMDNNFTINRGKYFLVDTPMEEYPSFFEDILDELLEKGLIPIIAHPEYNREIKNDLSIIERLAEKGCLLQLNTTSLFSSKTVRDFAIFLVKNKIYHLAASNAHGIGDYESFGESKKILKKFLDEDEVKDILVNNPKKVIEGEKIVPEKVEFKEKFHTKMNLRARLRRILPH